MEQEFIQMARRCSEEIRMLRAEINRLAPKADAYDSLAAVIRMFPQRSQGMSEDLSWLLDKRVQELTANKLKDTAK